MGRRLLSVVSWLAITALLLELACALAVETGLLASARPRYGGDGYWWGDHPRFGVWRHPEGRYEHESPCFRVTYRSNTAGARDVERPRESDQARVVVLGDSFLDGWGLEAAERLSNRLEAATGVPHLNFAMPHFGPFQQLLVYRELASRYDHDAVLLGLLPANDFLDSDLDRARELLDYEYRYRPYLLEDSGQGSEATSGDDSAPPGYARLDLREPGWRRWLRTHSYAFNALLRARAAWRARSAATEAGTPPARAAPPSWFYDFEASDLRRLEAVLGALLREAGGRPVALLLLPTLDDLRRFARSGPAPLAERLAEWADGRIEVVDLLPVLAASDRRWRRYFLPCDYHWSAYANRVAAERVRERLRDFYAPLRERRAP